jgi:DNA polymerase-4
LLSAGYRTFADVAGADLGKLRQVVGAERAIELMLLARGEDSRPVEAEREAKSYGEENTFEQDVRSRERVTEALTSHAESVARRLRHDGLEGRTLTLKIKLGRARGTRESRTQKGDAEPSYPLLTRSKTLPRATADGRVLRQVAIALWDAAAIAEPVRLLGVSVSNLSARDETQLELFAAESYARTKRLGPALDAIRSKFGEEAIRVGSAPPEKLTPTTRKKRGE